MFKQLRLVALVLLAGLLPAAARAGYDARAAELKADPFWKATVEQYPTVERAVADYLDERNRCFDDLVALMADTSAEAREAGWRDRIDRVKPKVDAITAALTAGGGEPSHLQFTLVNGIVAAEGRFLASLRDHQLGQHRDAIVQGGRRVCELDEARRKEWASLLEYDSAIDERERAMMERLKYETFGAYDRATLAARRAKEKLGEAVRDLIRVVQMVGGPVVAVLEKGGVFPPGSSEAYDAAAHGLDQVADYLVELIEINTSSSASFRRQVEELRGEMTIERERVHAMFRGLRADTDGFFRSNRVETVRERYDDAEYRLRALASASTPGQRADAESFASLFRDKLGAHRDAAVRCFQSFDSEHDGRFKGAVSAKTKEELLEERYWEEQSRAFERRNAEADLRQLKEEVRQFLDAQLAELPDADRAMVRKKIEARVHQAEERLEESRSRVAAFPQDVDRRSLKDGLE